MKNKDMDKMREKILEIMPCTCIPAYKDRGLSAPDCASCNYGEELADYITELLEAKDKELNQLKDLINGKSNNVLVKLQAKIKELEEEKESFGKAIDKGVNLEIDKDKRISYLEAKLKDYEEKYNKLLIEKSKSDFELGQWKGRYKALKQAQEDKK